MIDKLIKTPDASHPITVQRSGKHIVVTSAGRAIADSSDALVLHEASYPPVLYIPREHVDMDALERTDHATYCPYKGPCSYFSIVGLGARGKNAVWTYEAPYEAVAMIKDHLAFYPDRVDSIEERVA